MSALVDIKLVHKYLTRMLSDFDNFMLKNGIEYSIAYGTLLGAVRHQGFIPWDDDLDIFMTRDNYEKLLLLENKLPSYFYLQRAEVDSAYKLPFPKLRDDRLYVREGNGNDFGNSNGGFMDIFVVDGYGDGVLECLGYYALFNSFKKYRNRFIEANKLIYYSLSIPKNICSKIAKKAIYDVNNKYLFGNVKESEYMACPLFVEDGMLWKVSDFFPVERKYEFEGLMLPGPKNYDPVLKSFGYGDYMQLPPEDQRHTHLIEFKVLVP